MAVSAKVYQNTVILGKRKADQRHSPIGPFWLNHAICSTSCVTQRDVRINRDGRIRTGGTCLDCNRSK